MAKQYHGGQKYYFAVLIEYVIQVIKSDSAWKEINPFDMRFSPITLITQNKKRMLFTSLFHQVFEIA